MNRYVSILRGINVGGKRKILMADLKSLFETMGFTNISTYIQSGNVFFDTVKNYTYRELEQKIELAIKNKYAFEVPVIVRRTEEILKSISENPFYDENNFDNDRLHLTFLKEIPSIELVHKIKSINCTPDKFEINDKDIFVYCSGKYSDSKLTNQFFESKLKTTATTRNWKTVLKLQEFL